MIRVRGVCVYVCDGETRRLLSIKNEKNQKNTSTAVRTMAFSSGVLVSYCRPSTEACNGKKQATKAERRGNGLGSDA